MAEADRRALIRERIEFALNNVGIFLEIVEDNLARAQAEEDDDRRQWREAVIDVYGDDVWTDADVEIIGEQWQLKWGPPDPDEAHRPYSPLDRVFPRYLRYSFVTLAGLVLESELALLCDSLAHDRGLSPVNAGMGTILKPATKLLTTDTGIVADGDPIWRELREMSHVRNCIAHHAGRVTNFKYGKELEELSRTKRGLSIVPGRPGESVMVVDREYCQNLIDLIRRFFDKIFIAARY